MRSTKYLVLCFLVLTVYACNEQISVDNKTSADSISIPGNKDSVNNSPGVTDFASSDTQGSSNQFSLTGIHDLTLHWISWERPGKIDISPAENGWHPVKGSQKDGKGNFLLIEGELMALNPLELHFRGTIQTRVGSINNGDTCTRQGEQIFLSTRNRKYWRLQAMDNCEGNMVVDYIDIYF